MAPWAADPARASAAASACGRPPRAVTPLATPRSRPSAELLAALTNLGATVKSYASVADALEGQCAHVTSNDQILLFGSFFCVAEALEWLERQAPEA